MSYLDDFKYKGTLADITICMNAYQAVIYDIVYNLHDFKDRLYYTLNRTMNEWIDDIKYFSFSKISGIVQDIAIKANELSQENFVNKKNTILQVSKELNNFSILLRTLDELDEISYRSLSALEDSKLSFLKVLDKYGTEVFLDQNCLHHINELNLKHIPYFAYINPMISHFDYIQSMAERFYGFVEEPQKLQQFLQDEMIERLGVMVEQYGYILDHSFVQGYFSRHTHLLDNGDGATIAIRDIYRQSIVKGCEMYYQAVCEDFPDSTQENTQVGHKKLR